MPMPLYIAGAVTAFIYGLVIGSFLNVCIYRLPQGESLLHPPSHCPNCNNRLRPADLVPLFSFLLLGRKCRYCRKPISWRYFTIELITGLLLLACWISLAAQFGATLASSLGVALVVLMWVWTAAMLVTFMIDLDTTYVIEPVTWVAMGAGVLCAAIAAYFDPALVRNAPFAAMIKVPYVASLVSSLIGMAVGFLVFVGMNLFGWLIFRKPGMGLGDSYIGAAIGALLGPGLALISFGIAIVLGAVVGIFLIILGRLLPAPAPGSADSISEGALKEEDEEMPQGRYMPFGPFLTASAVLVALAPGWVLGVLHNLWVQYMKMF